MRGLKVHDSSWTWTCLSAHAACACQPLMGPRCGAGGGGSLIGQMRLCASTTRSAEVAPPFASRRFGWGGIQGATRPVRKKQAETECAAPFCDEKGQRVSRQLPIVSRRRGSSVSATGPCLGRLCWLQLLLSLLAGGRGSCASGGGAPRRRRPRSRRGGSEQERQHGRRADDEALTMSSAGVAFLGTEPRNS